MTSASGETEQITGFRRWFHKNGGFLHPECCFAQDQFGFSVRAKVALPLDSTVASCPFSLAITNEVARDALDALLLPDSTSKWTERQNICSYLCMHGIFDSSRHAEYHLTHQPYLNILPDPDSLRTSLHFTDEEMELLEGSNLYGATQNRTDEWLKEWAQCRDAFEKVQDGLGDVFTWEGYLTAATYLSSRAFPSTLLSPNPSLTVTATSYPILLPGVDSLNHARGQPVTWSVSGFDTKGSVDAKHSPSVSLVLHNPANAGDELFNNYGPKSNAELILGYGFSLPNNPDDTILLKISGLDTKWEIGREAKGAEAMWTELLNEVGKDVEEDDSEAEEDAIEAEVQAAAALNGMAEELLDRLPSVPEKGSSEVRPEVLTMIRHYIEGQVSILESLLDFFEKKEQIAMRRAEDEGVEIVLQLDEEEEEDNTNERGYTTSFNAARFPASPF